MLGINSKALIQADETPEAYRVRLYKNKDLYGLSNKEIGKLCNEAFGVSWDESSHRKKTREYIKGFNAAKDELGTTDEQLQQIIDEINVEKREAQRERMKLQAEKIEYNKWQRELARDELFEEKVINAIHEKLGTTTPPQNIPVVHNKRVGQLNITDSHFGKDFKVHGLFDEVINEYSPEIFYSRMEDLYSQTLEIVHNEGFNKIHMNNLGDHIEGFIRNSQIWSLRYGAVESAVLYGNYLADWLHKLSHNVNVIYNQTDGNHDEFRLLDGKKNEHLCESAGLIVKNCILQKNMGNPNFEYKSNKTGLIFDTICGYNTLGIHGEVSNLANALKEFAETYSVRIDYLLAGHKHHAEYKNCGVRKGVVGVGSIVGIDDYSMKLRKTADASAAFLVYEEGKGKVCEHTLILN